MLSAPASAKGLGDAHAFGRVEGLEHARVVAHPFVRLQYLRAGHERRRLQRPDVVELAPLGALDLERVAETLGRHHPDIGPLALDDRVGADGDAVDEALHRAQVAGEGRNSVQHPDRRLARRGGDFRPSQRAVSGVVCNRVGERAADVDPDAAACRIAGHESASPALSPERQGVERSRTIPHLRCRSVGGFARAALGVLPVDRLPAAPLLYLCLLRQLFPNLLPLALSIRG